jgi:hypothetical protein
MSNEIEYLTCLECGNEVDSRFYDQHMQYIHGGDEQIGMSSADSRLMKKKSRDRKMMKLGIGAVVAVVLLVMATFVFMQDSEPDPGYAGFQETQDEPNIVTVPDDDGGDDGSGDGTNGGGDGTNPDNNGTDPDPDPDPMVEAICIPIEDCSMEVKWYPYYSNGVEIRFFCGKSSDDEIHVAFDACDVCYEFKQGYSQDKSLMVCNACRKTFPIKAVGTENKAGGCWPSYLPMKIEDDKVVILISDLEEKRYMFE